MFFFKLVCFWTLLSVRENLKTYKKEFSTKWGIPVFITISFSKWLGFHKREGSTFDGHSFAQGGNSGLLDLKLLQVISSYFKLFLPTWRLLSSTSSLLLGSSSLLWTTWVILWATWMILWATWVVRGATWSYFKWLCSTWTDCVLLEVTLFYLMQLQVTWSFYERNLTVISKY